MEKKEPKFRIYEFLMGVVFTIMGIVFYATLSEGSLSIKVALDKAGLLIVAPLIFLTVGVFGLIIGILSIFFYFEDQQM